jgi:hypothetical protein
MLQPIPSSYPTLGGSNRLLTPYGVNIAPCLRARGTTTVREVVSCVISPLYVINYVFLNVLTLHAVVFLYDLRAKQKVARGLIEDHTFGMIFARPLILPSDVCYQLR